MGEQTGRIEIDRNPQEVFDFLADPANMPRYLPTVKEVVPLGEGQVLMRGEAHGHPYEATGWMKREDGPRVLEWGSDHRAGYHGWLQVSEAGQGAAVDLRLHDDPPPAAADRMEREHGSVDHAMRVALAQVLDQAKAACEGDRAPTSRAYGKTATMNPDI